MHLPYHLLLILLPPTLALRLSLSHPISSAISRTASLAPLVFPLLLISIFPAQISADSGIGIEKCGICLRDPRIGICGDPVCDGFITSMPRAGARVRGRGILRGDGVNDVNGVEGKEERSYGDPSDYPNGAQEGAASSLRIPRIFSIPSLVLNAIVSGREGILAAVVEKCVLCVPRTITRFLSLFPLPNLFIHSLSNIGVATAQEVEDKHGSPIGEPGFSNCGGVGQAQCSSASSLRIPYLFSFPTFLLHTISWNKISAQEVEKRDEDGCITYHGVTICSAASSLKTPKIFNLPILVFQFFFPGLTSARALPVGEKGIKERGCKGVGEVGLFVVSALSDISGTITSKLPSKSTFDEQLPTIELSRMVRSISSRFHILLKSFRRDGSIARDLVSRLEGNIEGRGEDNICQSPPGWLPHQCSGAVSTYSGIQVCFLGAMLGFLVGCLGLWG